jgi:hypothetical protein
MSKPGLIYCLKLNPLVTNIGEYFNFYNTEHTINPWTTSPPTKSIAQDRAAKQRLWAGTRRQAI